MRSANAVDLVNCEFWGFFVRIIACRIVEKFWLFTFATHWSAHWACLLVSRRCRRRRLSPQRTTRDMNFKIRARKEICWWENFRCVTHACRLLFAHFAQRKRQESYLFTQLYGNLVRHQNKIDLFSMRNYARSSRELSTMWKWLQGRASLIYGPDERMCRFEEFIIFQSGPQWDRWTKSCLSLRLMGTFNWMKSSNSTEWTCSTRQKRKCIEYKFQKFMRNSHNSQSRIPLSVVAAQLREQREIERESWAEFFYFFLLLDNMHLTHWRTENWDSLGEE